ncbi:MAG: tetratricopeptide repeat protein [Micropepsaceae bacterium]
MQSGDHAGLNGTDNNLPGPVPRPDDVLRDAYQLFAQGDPLGAERTLALLWSDTLHAPAAALHLLGHIRRRQLRLADAERYFRRAIAAHPSLPHHHASLGDLLTDVGALALAMESYAEAARLDSRSADIRLAMARTAMALGLFTAAEHAARAAIVLVPSRKAWELLALALGFADKLQDALNAIAEALAIEPGNPETQRVQADLLVRNGQNEHALRSLDRLIAQERATPAVMLSRGVALAHVARLSDAHTNFAEAVTRWPDHVELQRALANARWMLGERELFSRDFETAVKRNPDNIRMRIACADLLRRSDQRARSEELLLEGLARAPDDPALLQSMGVLLDELDRTEEGLRLLRTAHMRAPDVSQVRANLVCALLRLGRGDEALREIEPLRRAAPLNQEWICYETMALRQLGHPRYHELCDFDLMVRPYQLSAPAGFATIEAFNDALADSLLRLHVLEAHPLDQSVRGGSQTSRSLLHVDDLIIQTFLKMLDDPIRAYIDAMGTPDPNHPWSGRKTGRYRLTGAWSVKLKPGGFHINHVHPEGWISGPYYVKVPDVVSHGAGQQGWVTFGEPRWPTPECTVEKIVQPKPGLQVLFPSYFWHGTIPFSAGERMTAPLDAAPV